MKDDTFDSSRRDILKAALALGAFAGFGSLLPAFAAPGNRRYGNVLAGTAADAHYDLAIRRENFNIAGGLANTATTINGSIPGPLIELHEGHDAVLRVANHLAEDSSIHWHGILLPFEMDGVPGVAFPGISPRETFEARFPVRQSGTYWYHSHSGLQEQTGVIGPLVIHPANPDPFTYDRDYVVLLSDWTFEDPHRVMAQLKKMSAYYNFNERTVGDLFDDIEQKGLGKTIDERLMWGNMRMSSRDIADVTGHTYTYLMNGMHPAANWTADFNPGERIRLRFINGSAMSYFNVRIPGLEMQVVAADGQNIKPVPVDEFQIGVAETFDVIVQPVDDRAYTLMAESMDRSGYARGTLAPRPGMEAEVPPLRERPRRSMKDMGMAMDMDMEKGKMDDTHGAGMEGMHHGDMNMPSMSPVVAKHGPDHHGPGNISVADVQRNRLAERGTGLESVDHRVLVYTDLMRDADDFDTRPPSREIELHLTGNMHKYMWSFDGKKYSEVDGPIEFNYGERLRLVLVNDTMMEHPIHLHGMWMELENGHGKHIPRKHTISVKPAERLSVLINADARGRWAFHCHFLYHMEMGMFRVVRVSEGGAA
ncbi:MAG: copper resistance system multicopper oxidase [Xanthomonadales bacterium]|nr:copper resistance system multicopper oxidase [Xanthomonadales bacterium]